MSISFGTSFCCYIWFGFEKVMDNALCKRQNLSLSFYFFNAPSWCADSAKCKHLSLRLFYPLKYKIIVITLPALFF